MREDKAKEKWCPMVRYVPSRRFSFGSINAAINRWMDREDKQVSPDLCHCIASECMMWVVDEIKGRSYMVELEQTKPFIREAKETIGHCGLAK